MAAAGLPARLERRRDAWISLGIAVLVLWTTRRVLIDSARVLLELPPGGSMCPRSRLFWRMILGSRRSTDLHVWSVDGITPLVSAHLVSTEDADVLCAAAHERLATLGIAHATLQVEGVDVDCAQVDCGGGIGGQVGYDAGPTVASRLLSRPPDSAPRHARPRYRPRLLGHRLRCCREGPWKALSGRCRLCSAPPRSALWLSASWISTRLGQGDSRVSTGLGSHRVHLSAQVLGERLRLGHARGVALLASMQCGFDPAEYNPSTIKRTVGAHGKADKKAVARMVGMLLGGVPEGPADVTDALAIAICHHHHARMRKLTAASQTVAS